MATHTAHIVEPLLWRAPLTSGNGSLADAIRDKIAKTRAHLLDFIRLDEAHPHHAMTLAEWRQPAKLQSLLATYSDHIYRNQPAMTRVYRTDGASAHAGAVNAEEHAGTLT